MKRSNERDGYYYAHRTLDVVWISVALYVVYNYADWAYLKLWWEML